MVQAAQANFKDFRYVGVSHSASHLFNNLTSCGGKYFAFASNTKSETGGKVQIFS